MWGKNYHENLMLKLEQQVNHNFTIYVLPSVQNTRTGLIEKKQMEQEKAQGADY